MSFTPGPYRDGKTPDSIVSDHPMSIPVRDDTRDYYGGYVIAESVLPENKPLLKAAPLLYTALEELFNLLEVYEPDWYLVKHMNKAKHALAKARGDGQG